MKKLVLFVLIILAASTATAGEYNYISADILRDKILSDQEVKIIDIQVEKEFDQHHLPGSVATYAYPVKSSEDLGKLNKVVQILSDTEAPLVIVCPRGAGGAKRTYDYFVTKGIPETQLLILENGISGWDYSELLVAKGD